MNMNFQCVLNMNMNMNMNDYVLQAHLSLRMSFTALVLNKCVDFDTVSPFVGSKDTNY